MDNIDADFPIFVLCLAVVERNAYAEKIIPSMSALCTVDTFERRKVHTVFCKYLQKEINSSQTSAVSWNRCLLPFSLCA